MREHGARTRRVYRAVRLGVLAPRGGFGEGAMEEGRRCVPGCLHSRGTVRLGRTVALGQCHAWFFFDAPVTAAVARQVDCYSVVHATSRRYRVSTTVRFGLILFLAATPPHSRALALSTSVVEQSGTPVSSAPYVWAIDAAFIAPMPCTVIQSVIAASVRCMLIVSTVLRGCTPARWTSRDKSAREGSRAGGAECSQCDRIRCRDASAVACTMFAASVLVSSFKAVRLRAVARRE